MYGIIHKAVRSYVLKTAGPKVWDQIVDRCDLGDEHTLSSVYFDDSVTVEMVVASASILGVSVDKAFELVGEYWTEFAIETGYKSLFDMAGDSLPEFLSNLDRMHSSLKISLTQAVMPSFNLTHADDDGFEVIYRSQREGLETFVVGLLRGVAAYYGETLDISYEPAASGIRFTLIRKVSSQTPELALAS